MALFTKIERERKKADENCDNICIWNSCKFGVRNARR